MASWIPIHLYVEAVDHLKQCLRLHFRILPRINVRLSGVGVVWAEFVTTSIILETTSK